MSDRLRPIALAVLVLAVAAAPGVAGASDHDAQPTNDTTADLHAHLHVDVEMDESGMVVAVDYDGNGSATLTVAGVDGPYADAGSWKIDGEQRIRLGLPERADRVRITVETPRGSVEHTVRFETVEFGCYGASVSQRVPAAITYEATAEVGKETHTRQRTVELPVPDVDCPAQPRADDDSATSSRLEAAYETANERADEFRQDAAEGPDRSPRESDERSSENESAERDAWTALVDGSGVADGVLGTVAEALGLVERQPAASANAACDGEAEVRTDGAAASGECEASAGVDA